LSAHRKQRDWLAIASLFSLFTLPPPIALILGEAAITIGTRISEPGRSSPPTSSQEQSRLDTNGTASSSTPQMATSTPFCDPGSASSN
jgi:hypothetical protein